MKLSIKKLTLLAGMLSTFTVGTVHAQWILVDDFESYDAGTYNRDQGNLPYPVASNGSLGQMDIFTGIEGAGGEKAAWFWYGMHFGGGVWHQIPLPQEVGEQEQATVYFRLWQSAFELNWHVMFSKVPAGEEPENTSIWGNQSAIIRYFPSGIDAHSGGYVPSNPRLTPELATWYDYWVVLDNSYDANDEQVDVGGYQVYVRQPGEIEPTLMTWGTDATFDRLVFRNKEKASIKTMVLTQHGQHPGNVWLIDDIYFSPGVNISGIGHKWCGRDKVGWDVDTGDFLGWIWVGEATGAGWAYSYDLDGFVYLSACPDTSGAWVYVLN